MNITDAFNGKTLVITGGTGSFGSTVLKHFLTTDIGEIRIISRDEKKQDWMRHTLQAQYPEHAGKVQFYVGDVRNLDSVRDVMYGADFVFHAAALKEGSDEHHRDGQRDYGRGGGRGSARGLSLHGQGGLSY